MVDAAKSAMEVDNSISIVAEERRRRREGSLTESGRRGRFA